MSLKQRSQFNGSCDNSLTIKWRKDESPCYPVPSAGSVVQKKGPSEKRAVHLETACPTESSIYIGTRWTSTCIYCMRQLLTPNAIQSRYGGSQRLAKSIRCDSRVINRLELDTEFFSNGWRESKVFVCLLKNFKVLFENTLQDIK